MKNNPNGQFELAPSLFEGLASSKSLIFDCVKKEIENGYIADHAVDVAIAGAINQARQLDNGTNGDVVAQIDHIISELTKFKNNLDK